MPCPPYEYLTTQNSHIVALLGLLTATKSRKEINNFLYKTDIINEYLPHLKASVTIGI
jgi:hypothetical protein